MAWSKIVLSCSVDGRLIDITGILASTANTVHTAITGVGDFDEIFAYVINTATADREITFKWGVTVAGVTDVGRRQFSIRVTQLDGPVLVIPGWPLRAGNIVEAFATIAGQVLVGGYAHRVT